MLSWQCLGPAGLAVIAFGWWLLLRTKQPPQFLRGAKTGLYAGVGILLAFAIAGLVASPAGVFEGLSVIAVCSAGLFFLYSIREWGVQRGVIRGALVAVAVIVAIAAAVALRG